MTAGSGVLKKTPLNSIHRGLGAKLVDFHGWELPVQYSSIIKEHNAVRTAAGLFDVSHMGQVFVSGRGSLDFLQRVNSNDAARLAPGKAMYSHMLNEEGGVVDDVIVSMLAPERYFIVVNAAVAEGDVAWMKSRAAGFSVSIEDRSEEFGMVAIQGPRAAAIIGLAIPEAPALKRFGALELDLYGQTSFVTRTGYTGEDGFEVTAPRVILARVWQTLEAHGKSMGLLPCGLGARDTLRLEAGLLLYGADVDARHTPFEAGYGWVVKMGKGDFIGRAALEKKAAAGGGPKLTGFRLRESGVPRVGTRVFRGGALLGRLTSATYSPTLKAGIGLAYVDGGAQPGAPAEMDLYGRRVPAEAAAVPFYKRKS